MSDRREDSDDDGMFRAWRNSAKPVGLLATAATIVVVVILVVTAPRIEGAVYPIFARNEIPADSITRKGQKLCWTRSGFKNRAPPLTDVDVTVDYISSITNRLAHQPTPALYSEESGDELTSDDVPPAGVPFLKRVCLNLSSHIKPGQPVRVRQTAYFQSVTGLYDVPVTFPTIVLPADQAWIFSQRHDSAPTPNDADHAVAGPPPAEVAPPKDRHSETVPPDLMRDLRAEPLDRKSGGPVRMTERIQAEVTNGTRDRIEQYRQAHGLRSGAAAVRELLDAGLAADDRDALGPYDPERK